MQLVDTQHPTGYAKHMQPDMPTALEASLAC